MTRTSPLLPGTLDLLILKTLSVQSLHGYGIAQHVQRLQLKGCIKSKWRQSPTGRKARYYELTAAGKRQLTAEMKGFDRIIDAIRAVLAGAD